MAKTTLQLRLITAVIYGSILFLGTIIHPIFFTIVYAVLCALCAFEFLQMSSAKKNFTIVGTALSTVPIFYLSSRNITSYENKSLCYILLILVISAYLIYLLYRKKPVRIHLKYPFFMTMVYVALPFSVVVLASRFSGSFNGFNVIGIMGLLWANDSFAYLLGRKIGATPLFPRISPKKTWEGFISGALGAIMISFLIPLFKYIHPIMEGTLNHTQWVITALIVVSFGSIGDLIESMFKRNSNKKDSGSLLPGHGGFLDRLDSFIFCLTFVVFYWYFIC